MRHVWLRKGSRKDFGLAASKVLTIGSSSHGITFKEEKEVESVPGYNAIYLKECVVTIGGFDESVGGCEDWELNSRLRKAGYKLLGVPESPVEPTPRLYLTSGSSNCSKKTLSIL